jgi:hypothetical protein
MIIVKRNSVLAEAATKNTVVKVGAESSTNDILAVSAGIGIVAVGAIASVALWKANMAVGAIVSAGATLFLAPKVATKVSEYQS